MVEELTDELLLRILDLLPQSNLIATVPSVCIRWWRQSLDFRLWRNRKCNIRWYTDSAAFQFSSKSAALRSVGFKRRVGGAVLRCLTSHCPSITTLNLHYEQRLSLRTLRAITRKCDQIRHLHVNGEVLSCRRRAREVAFPNLRILELGEWMSLDTTLLETLKAAMPILPSSIEAVRWFLTKAKKYR